MGLLLPYPAGEALTTGIAVTVSTGEVVVATSGSTQPYVTTAPCADGAYPDLAAIGDEVWVTSSGSVTVGANVVATTAGAFATSTPTGAAAVWTAGQCIRTAANSRMLIVYNPTYHGADGP